MRGVDRHVAGSGAETVAARRANEPACKPDPVPPRDGAAATIHLGTPSPGTSSGPPAGSGEQPSDTCAPAPTRGAGFDLAPGGVYRAVVVTRDAGALLPHRFTLTGRQTTGGLFSVALSRGSPRVAVSNHPALWSPDFPRSRATGHVPEVPATAAARPTRSRCQIIPAGPDRWTIHIGLRDAPPIGAVPG